MLAAPILPGQEATLWSIPNFVMESTYRYPLLNSSSDVVNVTLVATNDIIQQRSKK